MINQVFTTKIAKESVMTTNFHDMFMQLIKADLRGRTALTLEMFGWLILIEGTIMLFAPHVVASTLNLPVLEPQGANYLRLAAVLIGGGGMLDGVSARLNAEGFMFASLLDRPLVPPLMAVLWYLGIIPGPLALAFAVQDFGSFLWTLVTWKAEMRKTAAA